MSASSIEVFLASPWVPAEWIEAHGLTPRGLFVGGRSGRREARTDCRSQIADCRLEMEPLRVGCCDGERTSKPSPAPLAAGVCAFAESVRRQAEAHRDAAFVFTTTCDQLRRAFDAVGEDAVSRCFLFNVPATWQSPASRTLFRAELERLGRFLERLGGRPPASAHLVEVMRRYNYYRHFLRDAADGHVPQGYAESVAWFHWSENPPFRESSGFPPSRAVSLALVGGPVLSTPDSGFASVGTIQRIEQAGGEVVLNAMEAGERGLFPREPQGDWSGDPLGALVGAYLDHGADVFQRPNTGLYAWLRPRLLARCVRGIVLHAFVGCDLWRGEARSLREAFGLPVLLLEADENPGGDAREADRLQAFVEMLR